MANTFKVTSVSSVATTVGANTSTIYTCPASTTTVVLALLLSNKHSSSVDTSVQLVSSTNNSGNNSNIGSNASAYIIKDVTIDEKTHKVTDIGYSPARENPRNPYATLESAWQGF